MGRLYQRFNWYRIVGTDFELCLCRVKARHILTWAIIARRANFIWLQRCIRVGQDGSKQILHPIQDGVYLESFPRLVTVLPLYPGTRVDLAIKCDGSIQSVQMSSVIYEFPIRTPAETFNVLTLNITTSDTAPDLDLPTVVVRKFRRFKTSHC